MSLFWSLFLKLGNKKPDGVLVRSAAQGGLRGLRLVPGQLGTKPLEEAQLLQGKAGTGHSFSTNMRFLRKESHKQEVSVEFPLCVCGCCCCSVIGRRVPVAAGWGRGRCSGPRPPAPRSLLESPCRCCTPGLHLSSAAALPKKKKNKKKTWQFQDFVQIQTWALTLLSNLNLSF